MQRYDKHTELQHSGNKAYSKLVILTGHLMGCRKKSQIMREFSGVCVDYAENMLDYTEI